eukprot:253332_1
MSSTSPRGTTSILNPPRGMHRSNSSPRGYTPTVNNDTEVKEKEEKKKKKKVFKVAIIGDPQVGKTTFLTKHLNDSFNASYHATIGASTFNLQFNTNLDTHLYEVFDVAGQNLFAGKRDRYYKDICGAVIMYDVMNWGSYENVTDIWLKELREKAPSGIPIVVVGNKMENRDTRAVSVEVVAEAISNTFEPDGVGYCEISVKTDQNLAEPFLFLTKRILNINDSKALYFVSKISELNLIESMLKHKKDKEESDAKAKHSPAVQASPSMSRSKDLDNLFLNQGDMNEDQGSAKGGDYLDDFIFSIGDRADKEKKRKDENFLADMMANSKPKTTSKTTKTAISKTPKVTSVKPKQQTQSSAQHRKRASSNVVKQVKPQASKTQPSKVKSKATKHHIPTDNQGVLIDLLLGLQQSINNVQLDMRRLQNDVTQIKQELQRNKSQRR